MLIKSIESRIIELGGTCNFQGKSLQDDLKSISFNKSFLTQDFGDYLNDEQYKIIKTKGIIPEDEL